LGRYSRERSVWIVVCLLLAFGWWQTGASVSAAELNSAGLVVRHADGQLSFSYVTFAEDEINGIELLKRSGFDIVTISFGGLGEGVCSIDEHGCPSTDCRKSVCQGAKADDPFWQYFRQVTSGEWKALALGASSTRVRNGDVDGWSWTGTTPGLPPLSLAEVAARAGYDPAAATTNASPTPGAVYRREGAVVASDEQGVLVYLIGGGLLIVASAIVVLAARGRRPDEAEL